MIPVVIASDGTLTKADLKKEWYNYSDKKWANIVLVSEDVRSQYMSAEPGTTINTSKVLAYYVWVPRYKYEIFGTKEDIKVNQDYNLNTVQLINIVFENKYTTKSNGSKKGTFVTHPAFTFGNDELNGIWVGKFETGYNGAKTSDEAKKNVIDPSKIIIKPNVYSWRYMKVSNMFYNSLGMNSDETVFGLTIDSDTHMMKNTDWGAVTYLTFSDYGKDSEVYKNNNNTLLTGCGADSLYGAADKTCLNAFGSKNNDIYNQSTTGNISGIFDMSGGAFEYLMGYTTGATNAYGSSQFTASTFPEAKYVDIYSSTNDTDYSKRILGDATGELGPFTNYDNSWYQGRANIPNSSYPWVARSGVYSDTDSGLAFFYMGNGTWNGSGSFRIVLT